MANACLLDIEEDTGHLVGVEGRGEEAVGAGGFGVVKSVHVAFRRVAPVRTHHHCQMPGHQTKTPVKVVRDPDLI